MLITEILAQNAETYGDKIALVERIPAKNIRQEITWSQFYQQACTLANALEAQGISKSDKVVQLMTNSLDWLPIYFGILYTGAWAVPLNFRFEAEKISLCTETAEAKAFIFGEEFIHRMESVKDDLDRHVETYIFTGPVENCPAWAVSMEDFTTGHTSAPPTTELNLEDDAALYFTSGTTGTPKAVRLSHKALAHACETENAHHAQCHEDVFLCIPPPLPHRGQNALDGQLQGRGQMRPAQRHQTPMDRGSHFPGKMHHCLAFGPLDP